MKPIRSVMHAIALMIINRLQPPETDGSFTRLYPDSKARNRRRALKRRPAQVDRPAGTKIARMAEAGRIGKAHP